MTRARARAIENEVDSLLFESRLDSCENWILPSSETLFVLRYQEDDREKERQETRASIEQENEEEVEKKEGSKMARPPGHSGFPAPPSTGARPPPPPPGRCPCSVRVLGHLAPGCPGPCPPPAASPECPGLGPRVPGPLSSRPPGATPGARPPVQSAAWGDPGCPGVSPRVPGPPSQPPPVWTGCPARCPGCPAEPVRGL
nr:WW domain-binding protein 11-like [Aegilops tauschii subsp. strangulata]